MAEDQDSTSPRPGERALTHVVAGPGGAASRMVDVGAKPLTRRSALARARVRFPAGVLARLLSGAGPKGPVAEVARTAGVMAAKRTADWIPLCHPLALDAVEVELEAAGDDLLEVRCRVRCQGRTGVEMEALVGASAAALTVYDMAKALDHGIAIEGVELLEKHGGASGSWIRPATPAGGAGERP